MKVEVSGRSRERKPMNSFTDTESSGEYCALSFSFFHATFDSSVARVPAPGGK